MAKDLYDSPLFTKRRRHAEATGKPWVIFSAEHGILGPQDVIEWYDVALAKLPVETRRRKGLEAVRQLESRFGSLRGKTFEIHAGAAYASAIAGPLASSGARLVNPLEGLQLGYQLQWYDHAQSLERGERPIAAPQRRQFARVSSGASTILPTAVPRKRGGPWSTEELLTEIDDYERELIARRLQPNSIKTYVDHPRRFVRWLAGNETKTELASAPPTAARTSRPRGSGSVPPALVELVTRWRSVGRPTQPGFDWPRQRWISKFPGWAKSLRGLPDQLDRATLSRIGAVASDDAAAAEWAFIAVMAWGFGNVGYGPFRTERILSVTPGAPGRLLRVARTLVDAGAVVAYRRFASESDCRLKGLGPAFGTKFLHFCQPAGQMPRALIHDFLVSSWLSRDAGYELNSTTWSEATYLAYLTLMHSWATTLGLAPDDVEYCIFQAMATERGSQWGEWGMNPK